MPNTPNTDSRRDCFRFRDVARGMPPTGRAGADDAWIDWYLNDEAIARAFTCRLPRELAALEDIACTVYLADRLARRRSPNRGKREEGWQRNLHLQIPVADLARWRDAGLVDELRSLLWLATNDHWGFEFKERRTLRSTELVEPLFRTPRVGARAALFSGGLDSLAGLCIDLATHPDQDFVVVSIRTNDRIGTVQDRLMVAIRDRFGRARELVHIRVNIGFEPDSHSFNNEERTQRSRGFLFVVLGAVAALTAGAQTLAVYENGIGAINLPQAATQYGAQNSRATHPHALSAIQQLLRNASGWPFAIDLPYLFKTKAQMCALLADLGMAPLAKFTVSCDGFPLRVRGQPQCGLCGSCLLRRQALHAGEIGEYDDPSQYRTDVTDPNTTLRFGQLYSFNAMLYQRDTIARAVASAEPWRALATRFPSLLDIVPYVAVCSDAPLFAESELVALYRRYSDEWDRVPLAPALTGLAA